MHGNKFFFFKQKTAYEFRISDWSSDVCSSDLRPAVPAAAPPDTDPRSAHRAAVPPAAHRRQPPSRVPARPSSRYQPAAVPGCTPPRPGCGSRKAPTPAQPISAMAKRLYQALSSAILLVATKPLTHRFENATTKHHGRKAFHEEIGNASGRARGCQTV